MANDTRNDDAATRDRTIEHGGCQWGDLCEHTDDQGQQCAEHVRRYLLGRILQHVYRHEGATAQAGDDLLQRIERDHAQAAR